VSGFEDDLSERQQLVAEQIVAGYTDKESANNLGLTVVEVRNTKGDVRQKAIQHLV
jgi:FixJ family two-component response regulator